MNKNEETKIKKWLKNSIDEFKDSDQIIIDNIIDYLKMNEAAKHQLAISVEENEKLDWVSVTTIATCTKNINLLMMSLGITPKERKKLKLMMEATADNSMNDLQSILND